MKNKSTLKLIISTTLTVAIMLTVMPTAQVEGMSIVGMLDPGETSTPFILQNRIFAFTDFIITAPNGNVSLTVTDPNGFTYSNYADGMFINGLIKGTPPASDSIESIVSDNNMAVRGVIDGVFRAIAIDNPIFGSKPWIFTVTSLTQDRRSYVVVVSQRSFITINGNHPVSTTSLDLSDRGLTHSSLWQLRAMSNLVELDLSDNLVSDLSPLRGLTDLRFSGLTRLNTLNLRGNPITDLSPLYGIKTMGQTLTVNLNDTPVTLAQINALKLTSPSNVVIEHNAVCDGCCEIFTGCTKCERFPCECPCADCGRVVCRCVRYVCSRDTGGNYGDWSFQNGTLIIKNNYATGAGSWRSYSNGFFRITDVTRVVIESDATNIGNNAFAFTEATSIVFKSATPPQIGASVFVGSPLTTVYVPAGSKVAYEDVEELSDFEIVEMFPFSIDVESEIDGVIAFGNGILRAIVDDISNLVLRIQKIEADRRSIDAFFNSVVESM